MFKKVVLVGVIALASACSTLGPQSAKEAYVNATWDAMFTQSYNFHQRITVKPGLIERFKDSFASGLTNSYNSMLAEAEANENEEAEDTVEAAEEKAITAAEAATANDLAEAVDPYEELLTELEDDAVESESKKNNNSARYLKSIDTFLGGFSVEAIGGYDPKRGLLEFTTGIQFKQHNVNASIDFPFLINWKDKSLAIGPNLLNFFLLPESSDQNLQGIIFKLSDAPTPIQATIEKYAGNLLPVLYRNFRKAYGELDDSQFSYASLADADKGISASKKVAFSLSSKDETDVMKKAIRNSISDLEKELETATSKEQEKNMLNAADLKIIKSFADIMISAIDAPNEIMSEDEDESEELDELTSFLDNSTSTGNLYLDYQGRPVRISTDYNFQIDSKMVPLVVSTLTFSSYGKPNFKYSSDKVKYLNGIDVFKSIKDDFDGSINKLLDTNNRL